MKILRIFGRWILKIIWPRGVVPAAALSCLIVNGETWGSLEVSCGRCCPIQGGPGYASDMYFSVSNCLQTHVTHDNDEADNRHQHF